MGIRGWGRHVERAAQPRPAAAQPRLRDDIGGLEEEGGRSRLVLPLEVELRLAPIDVGVITRE